MIQALQQNFSSDIFPSWTNNLKLPTETKHPWITKMTFCKDILYPCWQLEWHYPPGVCCSSGYINKYYWTLGALVSYGLANITRGYLVFTVFYMWQHCMLGYVNPGYVIMEYLLGLLTVEYGCILECSWSGYMPTHLLQSMD